jgi:hypothetical protein
MSILTVYKIIFLLLSPIEGSISFKSLESKTKDGKDVWNKITLISTPQKDVWKMKQSHHGKESKVWDDIEIIVSKGSRPFSAQFLQLKDNKLIDYKASCFRCHPNGPRLIRPHKDSKLNLRETLVLKKMNNLIKSYGYVQTHDVFKSKVPLINNLANSKINLTVNSCFKCHNGKERGFITKENTNTAIFLLKNKQMPPWPYTIDKADVNLLNEFL